MSKPIKIFTGEATRTLSQNVAKSYGVEMGKVNLQRFSDGEFQPSLEESVRDSHVIVIQSTMPPADNLFELLQIVDAAKRASAKSIVAVLPYFGYARQDRKDKPRVSIGAKLVANLLSAAGITRIITMDLHADQIQGFFEVPVDHLFASTVFVPYLAQLNLPNMVIGAPDTGGTKRAAAYAKHFDVPMAICYKQRKKANEIAEMRVIGDVTGKDVVLIDDICDTAGTLTKAAQMMMNQGANSVRAICTHAVLSGPAYERIEDSVLQSLIVTDTIPLKKESEKIEVLSVAQLVAETIESVVKRKSISKSFII